MFSRRIVGWSMKADRDASLVMDALMMAVWRRGKADASTPFETGLSQPHGVRGPRYASLTRCPQNRQQAITGSVLGENQQSGARNSHIASLVERSSRFVVLVKVCGKDSDGVVSALIARGRHLPQFVMNSLTRDRGTDLAYHRKFAIATDVSVYFCDRNSPWQCGSNENTNGLQRQYFPNGTDLSVYTRSDLVALRLNMRPRKTVGFLTPADTFDRAVALTG